MSYMACPHVTKNLCQMFVRQRSTGLQFNQQDVLDEKVSIEVAENSPILISNNQGILFSHIEACFFQAVYKTTLIHLFQMAVPQKPVQTETLLPNHITKFENSIIGSRHSLCILCLFVAHVLSFSCRAAAFEHDDGEVVGLRSPGGKEGVVADHPFAGFDQRQRRLLGQEFPEQSERVFFAALDQ